MSRERNSCPSEAGGLEKGTAALAKMFNDPRISQEENSCQSEARLKIRTAALVKLSYCPKLTVENEIQSGCPEREKEAVQSPTNQPGRRAECEGWRKDARKPKLLFGAPVDETIMKITTGWGTSSKESFKRRTHRVGTSWIIGQKFPSARQRAIKNLKTEKSERM